MCRTATPLASVFSLQFAMLQSRLKRRFVETPFSLDDDAGLHSLLAACCLSAQRADIVATERAVVEKQLVAFLAGCKPHAPAIVRQKLPVLARKLESILFQAATTREEYLDSSTLMHRLSAIRQVRQAKRRRVLAC
ncbi:hypothetical protein SPRG_01204 [Saprolegnia parasitica CBS 223.65]|uniref:Uncharacterized protein n=1 Tax=Saprolegnia parasitica (strain CBS 223.65) TaxID=695850 RepID=A0A067D808_SAPPC|nr:hypothetical protein SPRG_01204 [Saprolegnia parasitica CBS 223.65]KDO35137.1 hypothetical protein SPRG_01204 [Saprolegnia parasitica CBS 223.65]|eukprot:XP_012194786.1 hypothetical protein SPRG_01204 [Saprolegnia parasitica CBS 223.65]